MSPAFESMQPAPGVRLFGVTLNQSSAQDSGMEPPGTGDDSCGAAAAGRSKRRAGALHSPESDAAAPTKRPRSDEADRTMPAAADKLREIGHGSAWPPAQPAGSSPNALSPLAETLAAARSAGDDGKRRGSPSSTCARSSLNSGSSNFSVGEAADPSAALHRTSSLPRPVAAHAGAAAAPTPVSTAATVPQPAARPPTAANTLRLSAATAFAPYAAPPPAVQPTRQRDTAPSNPFAREVGSAYVQPPLAHPVARRPVRRGSSKRASLDSHASSEVQPPPLEGGAVALDGKTAAERRRETLAIQATLPPDLKICSSCRQIKSRDQYHACRAKKDQLQDRCKACRASLDAVRTALARPANAAARPVGALALERAARSSEPFMRSAAAIITLAGRSSCRRASEPVQQGPDPGAGRASSRRVSTPQRDGPSAVQLALSGVREDPASQMYQATARSAAAQVLPPPWNAFQQRQPPPGFPCAPQQPRSRLTAAAPVQPEQHPDTRRQAVKAPTVSTPPVPMQPMLDWQASKARWTLAALVCQSSDRKQLPTTALAAVLGISPAAGLLLAAAAACRQAQH